MLRTFAVLTFVVFTAIGSPAAAQDTWPSKPVTVVVPFAAGSNTPTPSLEFIPRGYPRVSASSS